MVYFEGMFIMLGGQYRSISTKVANRSTKLSKYVMKLDENTAEWSKLGELFQE